VNKIWSFDTNSFRKCVVAGAKSLQVANYFGRSLSVADAEPEPWPLHFSGAGANCVIFCLFIILTHKYKPQVVSRSQP
jgi:hypothetical protein